MNDDDDDDVNMVKAVVFKSGFCMFCNREFVQRAE